MDIDRVVGKLGINAVYMAQLLKEGKEVILCLDGDKLDMQARKPRLKR